jgi:hypothetical protein
MLGVIMMSVPLGIPVGLAAVVLIWPDLTFGQGRRGGCFGSRNGLALRPSGSWLADLSAWSGGDPSMVNKGS